MQLCKPLYVRTAERVLYGLKLSGTSFCSISGPLDFERVDYFAQEKRSVLKAQTERRLAAVLVADVVGYTRLMGRDDFGDACAPEGHPARAR